MNEDRYLQKRGDRWHYKRRVPSDVDHLDPRGVIRVSLKTASLEAARAKRDVLEEADTLYWDSLTAGAPREQAKARHEAAVKRARAMRLSYMVASELAQAPLEEIMHRFALVGEGTRPAEVEAVLGLVEEPETTWLEAFDVYCRKIAVKEVARKSPAQSKKWKRTKQRSVENFNKIAGGDKPIGSTTRAQAQAFHDWLLGRVEAGEITGSAANRDLGNVRKLFREYHRYQRVEVSNPFEALSSFDKGKKQRPAFPTAWIRDHLMAPGAMATLNEDARLVFYVIIETGARPSEIVNLLPEHIRLDHEVPHISVEPAVDMEIKTSTSVRLIPLVGISLEAMRLRPGGFPRYRDKGTHLSNTLNKYLRENGLTPTARHTVYSLRHAFEDRMAEAGLDYGLRCLLMGHSLDRPSYGDGVTLARRRDELLRIALPVPAGLLSG